MSQSFPNVCLSAEKYFLGNIGVPRLRTLSEYTRKRRSTAMSVSLTSPPARVFLTTARCLRGMASRFLLSSAQIGLEKLAYRSHLFCQFRREACRLRNSR